MARPRAAPGRAMTSPGTADIDLSDVPGDLRRAVGAALHAAGVSDGHIGLQIVGEGRMRTLNYAARGVDEATDVLAFPIDEPLKAGSSSSSPAEDPRSYSGPRELGDVFICPEKATDVTEAAVHGALHLCGYDHETDSGEMLELQAKVMASLEQ
jgi:probable rRNA maturation factor